MARTPVDRPVLIKVRGQVVSVLSPDEAERLGRDLLVLVGTLIADRRRRGPSGSPLSGERERREWRDRRTGVDRRWERERRRAERREPLADAAWEGAERRKNHRRRGGRRGRERRIADVCAGFLRDQAAGLYTSLVEDPGAVREAAQTGAVALAGEPPANRTEAGLESHQCAGETQAIPAFEETPTPQVQDKPAEPTRAPKAARNKGRASRSKRASKRSTKKKSPRGRRQKPEG